MVYGKDADSMIKRALAMRLNVSAVTYDGDTVRISDIKVRRKGDTTIYGTVTGGNLDDVLESRFVTLYHTDIKRVEITII